MARRFFKIKVSEDAEIQVFIEIVSGLIVNFVVKLILTINSDQYEIIRFDSGHNCPHKGLGSGLFCWHSHYWLGGASTACHPLLVAGGVRS